MGAVRNSHFLKQLKCGFLAGHSAPGLDPHRHHHVLQRGKIHQKIMELENESNGLIAEQRAFVRAKLRQFHTANPDRALIALVKGPNQVEQGAFSGARSSHDGNRILLCNLKVDPPENMQHISLSIPVFLMEVANRDES